MKETGDVNMVTIDLIQEAVRECFETMSYLELSNCSKNSVDLENLRNELAGKIEFEGEISGIIKIFTSKKIMELSTCNMLGMSEEDVSEKMCLDTLKEFLNIIAGSLLRKLDEGSRIANLGFPSLIEKESRPPKSTIFDNKSAMYSFFKESELEDFCLILESPGG